MKPIDSIVYCKLLLRNALMSMDPTTGYIKAWVGGTNFEHFKYDQVKNGTRQVGSTAKPFTYAVAIENGFSPCMEVANNVPDTIRLRQRRGHPAHHHRNLTGHHYACARHWPTRKTGLRLM
jgi:penicillin-binding protein 1A